MLCCKWGPRARVRRVQLACEQRAALKRLHSREAPCLKRGCFGLWRLQTAARSRCEPRGPAVLAAKGRWPHAPPRPARRAGCRGAPGHPAPGRFRGPARRRCPLCREGSGNFCGSLTPRHCSCRVGFLVRAQERREDARPRRSWAGDGGGIAPRGGRAAGRRDRPPRPRLSAPSGFHPAMDLLSSTPDDCADAPVRK